MDGKNFLKKTLVFLIIALFFCVIVTPCINAVIHYNENAEKNNEQTNDIVLNPLNSLKAEDVISLTFYTFDKTLIKQNKIDLPYNSAIEIKNIFEKLEYKIVYEPTSIETQEFKNDFINLIDEYGLLSEKQSKDEVFSLLNPSWLKLVNNNDFPRTKNLFSNAFIRPFFSSYFGTSVFCSVSSGGSGLLTPLFMLPRPRAVAFWVSSDAVTSVANLFTGKGFLAGGVQSGWLVGFIGVGLTYAVPGVTLYGFIGYSLFAGVTAEYMEFLPPNREPVISEESPSDDTYDVPVSLSKLSFRIDDPDGDFMNYSVTTDPDVGSGQGLKKKNGVYSIDISGLEWNKKYSWTVKLSDGKVLVEKKFSFITVESPFDPFNEGWLYRKKITVNHTLVDGNLFDFPVLVSVFDSDLRDKTQVDGGDILFMDGTGVANKANHEIENYDKSSGELVAWVKIPNLSGNQDTEFYMYYGNPNCSNQQFPEKVWDTNYCGVWHLADFKDSTKNKNDGTNHGTNLTAGKIGNARDFEKNNSAYITWGDMPEPADGKISTGTFQMWVKPDNTIGETIGKANSGDYEPDRMSYFLYIHLGQIGFWALSGKWYPDQRRIFTITDEPCITTENWQYISAVVDLSIQNIDLYHNGQEMDSTKTVEGSPPLYFYDVDYSDESGRNVGESGTSYYNGVIDELRISKICRSSSWISTEYNNQIDPLSFLSFGPEEAPP